MQHEPLVLLGGQHEPLVLLGWSESNILLFSYRLQMPAVFWVCDNPTSRRILDCCEPR